jgi:hypothetical protein
VWTNRLFLPLRTPTNRVNLPIVCPIPTPRAIGTAPATADTWEAMT